MYCQAYVDSIKMHFYYITFYYKFVVGGILAF